MDFFDNPILSYRLVCDSQEPLTNRMVMSRGWYGCWICADLIGKGERVRAESRRSADGRRIQTRRVCATCCTAIEAYMTKAKPGRKPGADAEFDALEARWAMGSAARKAAA